MMNTLLLWESLCAVLLWSVFCRLIHVDKTTKVSVRLVLVVAGLGALIGIGAPLYGWLPDGPMLAVFGPMVVMEMIVSQNWRYGLPVQFIRDMYRPHRRFDDPRP